MRYFYTINASRPVVTPVATHEFEPVGQRGGSWFGVLAVADDAAANALVGQFGVDELTLEDYERLKKKITPPSSLTVSPQVPAPLSVADAKPAEDPIAPITGSVTLESTDVEPQPEPLLEEVRKPRRGRA